MQLHHNSLLETGNKVASTARTASTQSILPLLLCRTVIRKQPGQKFRQSDKATCLGGQWWRSALQSNRPCTSRAATSRPRRVRSESLHHLYGQCLRTQSPGQSTSATLKIGIAVRWNWWVVGEVFRKSKHCFVICTNEKHVQELSEESEFECTAMTTLELRYRGRN